MKKRILIFCGVAVVVIGLFVLSQKDGQAPTTTEPLVHAPAQEAPEPALEPAAPEPQQKTIPRKVQLTMPYIHETPDHVWTGPWKNACEEASIAIVEQYYTGKTSITKDEAKQYMSALFDLENATWGSNADSDAARTQEIIEMATSYRATVKDNPTVEEIKKELQEGRPVISMHYGFALKNKNIPFLATGSSYHMMVIVGYDEDAGEFIVHDVGDMVAGTYHRYKYDLFMNSLHDFNYAEKKANGPPRVLFTAAK